MRTAEEYFAELARCLQSLPEAEREETLTYYREYAQEGGLLDAEQLREHFGPPSALAARILEDGAGKRPTGQAAQPAQAAPQPPRQTQTHPLVIAVGILLVVAVLASLMLGFLHAEPEAEGPLPTAPAKTTADGTATAENGGTPGQSYDGAVEPFTGIDVDVVAADIRIEIGSGYALRYTLPDSERVERCEVKNGTLALISKDKSDWHVNDGIGEVCITVPASAALKDLSLSCVGGSVTVPEITCQDLTVDNTAGNVTLDCKAAGNVRVDSTAGSMRFGGSCNRLEADNTAGDLIFTGAADTVVMDTTSGNVSVSGTVTREIQADTTSGDIAVTAADPTVTADGHSIRWNGEEMPGDEWSRQGTGCEVKLDTVSGSITVDTP